MLGKQMALQLCPGRQVDSMTAKVLPNASHLQPLYPLQPG